MQVNLLKQINGKSVAFFLILLAVISFVKAPIFGDLSGDEVVVQASGGITFCDHPLSIDKPFYFVTGRLYVPLAETITAIGGSIDFADDSYILKWQDVTCEIMIENDELLYKQLYFVDEKPYIYIYDLAEICNLSVVFNSNENIAALYYRQIQQYDDNDTDNLNRAYLRLEDVTADFGVGGNFTDEGLEKLRVIADYLYGKSQSYQIAWIPLYTNPKKGIQNDLSNNFNFYNAGFIYTLDYILNHNGDIVIHGLTHQENDTVSAVGTEFGPNTPYTLDEIENRMERAKEIAKTLGFETNKFEFPHYSFTHKQLKIAEKHFDYIYQQYPYAKVYGFIERVRKFGGTVTYVPTPFGYIHSRDETDDVLKKISSDNTHFKGIFMHPYIDFIKINCATSDSVRISTYDESGIIQQVVKKMLELGYTFSEIR